MSTIGAIVLLYALGTPGLFTADEAKNECVCEPIETKCTPENPSCHETQSYEDQCVDQSGQTISVRWSEFRCNAWIKCVTTYRKKGDCTQDDCKPTTRECNKNYEEWTVNPSCDGCSCSNPPDEPDEPTC